MNKNKTIDIKQAVILAGGKGIRLRPLTLNTPKPMIEIHSKPFLEYLLSILKKNGIRKVILLVGFHHEKIREYFANGEKFCLKIRYSYLPPEADTGTRLRHAYPLFDNIFLLLYGDNIWPLHLPTLMEYFQKQNTKALITVYNNFDNSRKSNIYVDNNGFITLYDRTRKSANVNGVDVGFFILEKNIFSDSPGFNFSFEDTIIPKLIKEKQLSGYLTHHKYYSLTNRERLQEVINYLTKKKVVFLDRDGIINKKAEKARYITSWSQFSFLPRVKKALKKLSDHGFNLFIITNQPGVARAVMNEKDLTNIHTRMLDELEKSGVTIEKVYSCTHGWNEECFCRKPNPGLFFQAAVDHHLNLFDTYVIGDDERDIMAGKLAGCKTAYLQNKSYQPAFPKNQFPDIIATSLISIVEKIIQL